MQMATGSLLVLVLFTSRNCSAADVAWLIRSVLVSVVLPRSCCSSRTSGARSQLGSAPFFRYRTGRTGRETIEEVIAAAGMLSGKVSAIVIAGARDRASQLRGSSIPLDAESYDLLTTIFNPKARSMTAR
jgi:hypothetical protein